MHKLNKDVMVACDFSSRAEVMDFLGLFTEEKPFVKIGMELYYAEGPDIVRAVKARGHRIFLDLKLHDIPNTVRKAMAVLSSLDVDMCNLHAAGTVPMMQEALKGLTRPDGSRPLLIAVHEVCGGDFLTVTPGVRFADGDKGDQVRVTTPARARELGSDFIVVGRPITQADDPVAAYRRCVREFLG